MSENQKLFFIDSITPVYINNSDQYEKFEVALWPVTMDKDNTKTSLKSSWPEINIVWKTFPAQYISNYEKNENEWLLREGNFILTSEDPNDLSYQNANTDKLARYNIFRNNILRSKGINAYNKKSVLRNNKIKQIKSFHVNVGHGNCSIIALNCGKETEIWMIDCSTEDRGRKSDMSVAHNYTANLETCINYIMTELEMKKFKIHKFFLTHPHFDHYNGLRYLLKQHYLSESEVWINFHYSWPQTEYNSILEGLFEENCNFIEPIVKNSIFPIAILHPEQSLRRKTFTNLSGKTINNSSVVYNFTFNKKSIIFPGDIETKGWNELQHCHYYLEKCNYFCISHHGSINGHKRNICPRGNIVDSIQDCLPSVELAILMGRDGAFNGIFSPEVMHTFSQNLISLNPFSFIVVNWFSDESVLGVKSVLEKKLICKLKKK